MLHDSIVDAGSVSEKFRWAKHAVKLPKYAIAILFFGLNYSIDACSTLSEMDDELWRTNPACYTFFKNNLIRSNTVTCGVGHQVFDNYQYFTNDASPWECMAVLEKVAIGLYFCGIAITILCIISIILTE